jgi:histidinol dehydrogenase
VLTRLDLRGTDDLVGSIPRPPEIGEGPMAAVVEIIASVRSGGDAVLRELTEKVDGVRLDSLRVECDQLEAAAARTDPEVVSALGLAAERIRTHHVGQLDAEVTHNSDGVVVTSYSVPVGSVGCYVPGGRAAYPSTLLMTAVPAQVAGVERVVVCVPPNGETNSVADVTLAAAHVAGVEEVYAVGGAQAIAALAYGTESIPAVDVICGPGNIYVALAKQVVAAKVGIAAAFAGPSEVVVVADSSVEPDLIAIDVMLQAEHGPDGLAWVITWDERVADAVESSLEKLLAGAPRAADITSTLERSGYCVVVDSPQAAIKVSDVVAPEHLELMCEGAEDLARTVSNAGAIFCGALSPASIGDYLAGPSHVLPTHGSARFASALTVDDFTRHHHVITASARGIQEVGPAAATLATAEGLDAHAQSINMRLDLLGRGAPAGPHGKPDPDGEGGS